MGESVFQEHFVFSVNPLKTTLDIDRMGDESLGSSKWLQLQISEYFGGE